MNKKAIEEKLLALDDKIDIIQEPVHHVFDKIIADFDEINNDTRS